MSSSGFILTGVFRSCRTGKVSYTSDELIAMHTPSKVFHKLILSSLGEPSLFGTWVLCYCLVMCRSRFSPTLKSCVIFLYQLLTVICKGPKKSKDCWVISHCKAFCSLTAIFWVWELEYWTFNDLFSLLIVIIISSLGCRRLLQYNTEWNTAI